MNECLALRLIRHFRSVPADAVRTLRRLTVCLDKHLRSESVPVYAAGGAHRRSGRTSEFASAVSASACDLARLSAITGRGAEWAILDSNNRVKPSEKAPITTLGAAKSAADSPDDNSGSEPNSNGADDDDEPPATVANGVQATTGAQQVVDRAKVGNGVAPTSTPTTPHGRPEVVPREWFSKSADGHNGSAAFGGRSSSIPRSPGSGALADTLAMLSRLPLTDYERTAAVRAILCAPPAPTPHQDDPCWPNGPDAPAPGDSPDYACGEGDELIDAAHDLDRPLAARRVRRPPGWGKKRPPKKDEPPTPPTIRFPPPGDPPYGDALRVILAWLSTSTQRSIKGMADRIRSLKRTDRFPAWFLAHVEHVAREGDEPDE